MGRPAKPYLCSCGETNPDNFYPKDKGSCKVCRRARVSEYQRENREACTERQTNWKRNNRERARESNRISARNNKETRRAKQQRRRAKKMGLFVEDVQSLVLAERDDGQCQICGKDIDLFLSWPHPMSFSVDHIIPLCLNGEHSYANTQSAHLSCNLYKWHYQDKPKYEVTL